MDRAIAKEAAEFGSCPKTSSESFSRRLAQYVSIAQRHERDDLRRLAQMHLPLIPPHSSTLQTVKLLTRWFKTDYFAWLDRPKCETCGSGTKEGMVGYGEARESETAGGVRRVELYECGKAEVGCKGQGRFARYQHAERLLERREGRCGEWANCFHLLLRAAGVEARKVYDWRDHVWVEAWVTEESSDKEVGRWVHVDCCEGCVDEMGLYERGWGKKLDYVVAVGRLGVVDVTRGYVESWEVTRKERVLVGEEELIGIIDRLNEKVLNSLNSEGDRALASDIGLKVSERHKTVNSELSGGVSGPREWIERSAEQWSKTKW